MSQQELKVNAHPYWSRGLFYRGSFRTNGIWRIRLKWWLAPVTAIRRTTLLYLHSSISTLLRPSFMQPLLSLVIRSSPPHKHQICKLFFLHFFCSVKGEKEEVVKMSSWYGCMKSFIFLSESPSRMGRPSCHMRNNEQLFIWIALFMNKQYSPPVIYVIAKILNIFIKMPSWPLSWSKVQGHNR